MKFFWFFFILFTIASLLYAASQKTCETVIVKGIPVEECSPSTPIGKWLLNNLGFTL